MNTDPQIKKLFDLSKRPQEDKIKSLIEKIGSKDPDATVELVNVLGKKPKRPLYYVAMHICYLPDSGSRDVIRYCGDYVDQLVRFTLEDNRYLSKWFLKPLGGNLRLLKKYIDEDLYIELELFNKVYTSAKHDFHHEEDKSWFNYVDTIHYVFITKYLAEKILPLSERAQDYNHHGETFYAYHPVD